MPSTTTYHTIRDNIVSLVRGITPTLLTAQREAFDRCPLDESVRDYAARVGSGSLRKFDVRRDENEASQEPLVFDPTAYERREWILITVAYPVLPAKYGAGDLYDIEKVMRSDAAQIRDKVFSPSNYVSGQSLAFVTIEPPDTENSKIWFQPIRVELVFTEAQSL